MKPEAISTVTIRTVAIGTILFGLLGFAHMWAWHHQASVELNTALARKNAAHLLAGIITFLSANVIARASYRGKGSQHAVPGYASQARQP